MKALLLPLARILITILVLSSSSLAVAEEPTFAKLQAMCKDAKDLMSYGYCIGFVEAIALRVAHANKNCPLLQNFIDHPNANLGFPDMIADLDPKEYVGSALNAVEKYFLNKGCM